MLLQRTRIEHTIVILQVMSLIKTNRGNVSRVANLLVLSESPGGFALVQLLDQGKFENMKDLWKEFEMQDSTRKVVKLKAFSKSANAVEALGGAISIVDSKLSKGLRNFRNFGVADSKLGNIIQEKLALDCVKNNLVMELMRGLRPIELTSGLEEYQMGRMSLGLSHGLSRHKLKFSPEKVDTLIVQAIGLLDDIDKELNTYAMTVREWYGWHFPELSKIILDNIQYAKVVKLTGSRTEVAKLDYSAILAEEIEVEMKEAAAISVGIEVTDHDMLNTRTLCDRVTVLSEYRIQLLYYLRSRMTAIAPNLIPLVGELVGARLIAHAGSLMKLAKLPSSTLQILGAEKVLFGALKTGQNPYKYGLIYQASLIEQAGPKFKGKIARILAAKAALSIRLDALGEGGEATIGVENRLKVEARLRQLDGRTPRLDLVTAAQTDNPAADSTIATRLDEGQPGKKQNGREVSEVERITEQLSTLSLH